MSINPFEGQLQRLARTLTDRFGVQVVFQGENAYTNGKVIVLPSLPEPMSEPLERMVVGFLDHEMGHVAFSDFEVAGEFAANHPGYEGLLNVVEDARVERECMQRWPGVRANLDTMFEQIRVRIERLLLQRDEFDRFCTAVYLRLSHHNDLMGLEPLVAGYEDLLGEFPRVRASKDSADLAERILARWLQQNPPGQAPAASSATDEGDEPANGPGQAGQGQSDGQSAVDSPDSDADLAGDRQEDGNPDDSAGSAQQSDSSDDEAATSPDQDDAAEISAVPGDEADEQAGSRADETSAGGFGTTTLLGEALTEAIGEIAVSASGEYRVYTKQHDRIGIVPAAGEPQVKALLETGKDEVRRLRRGLANVLRSAEKRWWREDQTRGALSPRTLHRLCTDRSELNVFRTRSMVQGQSTAVSIVLDASGSMTTRKMVVVRESTRVLLEALADLKIPTEAFTFTTGNACCLNDATEAAGEDMTTLQQRFARFSNLEIGLVKQFAEPVKVALSRLPSTRGTGLTPLGEAMQIGAMRLLPRPETRKVMLVLTDGRPGCEGSETAAMTHAQRVTGMIGSVGVELIGVGIQDEALREIVADTVVVHELKDLPAQLCKLLGRTLQKGLRHVG